MVDDARRNNGRNPNSKATQFKRQRMNALKALPKRDIDDGGAFAGDPRVTHAMLFALYLECPKQKPTKNKPAGRRIPDLYRKLQAMKEAGEFTEIPSSAQLSRYRAQQDWDTMAIAYDVEVINEVRANLKQRDVNRIMEAVDHLDAAFDKTVILIRAATDAEQLIRELVASGELTDELLKMISKAKLELKGSAPELKNLTDIAEKMMLLRANLTENTRAERDEWSGMNTEQKLQHVGTLEKRLAQYHSDLRADGTERGRSAPDGGADQLH